jgi:thiol-disulfide isomerase/thioredoxin
VPESTATLDDDEPGRHGRVGYGRFGRWSPLGLAALLLLALGAIWWFGRDAESLAERERRTGNIQGEPAPDVTLTRLDGQPLRLADLAGNVVVLNFWASWCEPCRTEAPILQALSEEAAATGEKTVVVGVGIRTDDDEAARQFVIDYGLTYPIGRDTVTEEPGAGPIEKAFGIPSAYPSTLFIAPDGKVDRYHLGPISMAQLQYAIDEAR